MVAAGLEVKLRAVVQDQFDRVRPRAKAGMKKSIFSAASLVRTIARRSIRKRTKNSRTKISKPGSPPHSHTGALKGRGRATGILFAVDSNRQNAVIGPVRATRKERGTPSRLEFGGTRTVIVGRRRRRRRLTVKARPFMGPALRKARPKLVEFWRESLR